MNDLISRQAAIDAIFSEPLYESGMKKRDADAVVPAIYEKIKSLPSTETHDKRTETHACDCISRQAAIDALANYIHNVDKVCGMGKLLSADDCKDAAKRVLDDLPSIQPTYTEAQLQKMQDLEQVQLEKVFDLGREDARAEIIYCGECKHADYARKDILGRIYCMNHGFYWDALAYCSYAERRTNETD